MNREQVLAIVRMILGTVQVMGATTGVILLVRTGVNELSVGAVVVTGVFALTSILLFRNRETK